MTRGKQLNDRYNCTWKHFLKGYKPLLPKKKRIYINKYMPFTVFNFGHLNFESDSLIWKVSVKRCKIMTCWYKMTETVVEKHTPKQTTDDLGIKVWFIGPWQYTLNIKYQYHCTWHHKIIPLHFRMDERQRYFNWRQRYRYVQKTFNESLVLDIS